jgi:hypothetical protein
MASDDFDRAEVDRLVKELATPPKPPVPRPAFAALAAEAAEPPPATAPGGPAPGRPWTTARLLMPAMRTERRKSFAFASAISLPTLPRIALPALNETEWATLSVRTFVGLGVLLSAAMPYWPYSHAWSWGLLLYVSAILLVVVTGIWGAKLTWDARLPAAHTIAVGILIWGLGLLAAETVPRIGYALDYRMDRWVTLLPS